MEFFTEGIKATYEHTWNSGCNNKSVKKKKLLKKHVYIKILHNGHRLFKVCFSEILRIVVL